MYGLCVANSYGGLIIILGTVGLFTSWFLFFFPIMNVLCRKNWRERSMGGPSLLSGPLWYWWRDCCINCWSDITGWSIEPNVLSMRLFWYWTNSFSSLLYYSIDCLFFSFLLFYFIFIWIIDATKWPIFGTLTYFSRSQ